MIMTKQIDASIANTSMWSCRFGMRSYYAKNIRYFTGVSSFPIPKQRFNSNAISRLYVPIGQTSQSWRKNQFDQKKLKSALCKIAKNFIRMEMVIVITTSQYFIIYFPKKTEWKWRNLCKYDQLYCDNSEKFNKIETTNTCTDIHTISVRKFKTVEKWEREREVFQLQ